MVDDFILVLEQFVPREDCDKLVEEFESSPEKMVDGMIGGYGGAGVLNFSRKKCMETYHCFYDEKEKSCIQKYAPLAIKKYMEKYTFLENIYPFDMSNTYKVQRYYPNEGFFDLHCESPTNKLPSVLAWMIYLNDVTDGGYTEFPSQGKKYQPRAGNFLIWPAFFTHPHRGVASKTQTKYIVTGWCDYSDQIINSKTVPNISYE